MTAAYRDTTLVCPACRDPLTPAQVHDAIIDVCDGCGGVWVDWFDGDLVQMIRGAPRVAVATPPAAGGSSSCPRCHVGLAAERYHEGRAAVLRCAECAGVFVARADLEAIAGVSEPRAPLDAFSKLADTLQRWLGWKET